MLLPGPPGESFLELLQRTGNHLSDRAEVPQELEGDGQTHVRSLPEESQCSPAMTVLGPERPREAVSVVRLRTDDVAQVRRDVARVLALQEAEAPRASQIVLNFRPAAFTHRLVFRGRGLCARGHCRDENVDMFVVVQQQALEVVSQRLGCGWGLELLKQDVMLSHESHCSPAHDHVHVILELEEVQLHGNG